MKSKVRRRRERKRKCNKMRRVERRVRKWWKEKSN